MIAGGAEGTAGGGDAKGTAGAGGGCVLSLPPVFGMGKGTGRAPAMDGTLIHDCRDELLVVVEEHKTFCWATQTRRSTCGLGTERVMAS